MIISCSHGKHLAKSIARKSNKKYSELLVDKFPDDELRVRFNIDVRKKDVFIVQSFYNNISDCILEAILAAATARELGARKIILVAPYFPYVRQDKSFHKGEAVSQMIVAGLFDKYFDEIYVMDPHLHRKSSVKQIFKMKSHRMTANNLIADYIRKKIRNAVIIGPDWESYKWARKVAEMINVESAIMEKKRYSSYHVEVKLSKKIDLRNKNVVIIDDIVSTGHTIIEAAKLLRKIGARKITCICVHGIFAADGLEKLRKAKINVVSTNTIPSSVAKIDVSGEIAHALKNQLK